MWIWSERPWRQITFDEKFLQSVIIIGTSCRHNFPKHNKGICNLRIAINIKKLSQ